MTTKEIIEYINTHTFEDIMENIPDDCYNEEIIIKMLPQYRKQAYFLAKNSDFSGISKDTALLLLGVTNPKSTLNKSYDNYSILSPNLQSDPDIIRIVTSDIEHLPKDFYKNRECMKYLLNKYNEGNSRAAFGGADLFVIATDISIPYHPFNNPVITYMFDSNISYYQINPDSVKDISNIDFTQPFETVAPKIFLSLRGGRGYNVTPIGGFVTKIKGSNITFPTITKPKERKPCSMTNKEIIEYIKTHEIEEVKENIPDDCYNEEILRGIFPRFRRRIYSLAKNSDFSDMTKETALLLLGEPKTEYRTDKSYDNYSILPPNLQSDPDIIRIVTSDIEHLPKDFYKNRECMKYLLNKYNEGNSRAAFDGDDIFIIVPDISIPYHPFNNPFIIYVGDYNASSCQINPDTIKEVRDIDISQPFEKIAYKFCYAIRDSRGNHLNTGEKYITKIED